MNSIIERFLVFVAVLTAPKISIATTITGSIENSPTDENVWTTGTHGVLKDGLRLMLQLTVEALEWFRVIVSVLLRHPSAGGRRKEQRGHPALDPENARQLRGMSRR